MIIWLSPNAWKSRPKHGFGPKRHQARQGTIRSRPKCVRFWPRVLKRVLEPTGSTNTHMDKTKHHPDVISSSWVPHVVYIGLRARFTDLKPDPIASNIPTIG